MKTYRRIAIAGTSGCGKTTFGRHLSKFMGIKFIDLDDLYWLPGWQERTGDEFLKLIREELHSESWIIAGNYSKVRDEIWSHADIVVWLDLSLPICLFRGFKRSLNLLLKNTPTCNGNFETWSRFLGKKSILLWIWNTHAKRRKAYASYGSKLTRLRAPKEVRTFHLGKR